MRELVGLITILSSQQGVVVFRQYAVLKSLNHVRKNERRAIKIHETSVTVYTYTCIACFSRSSSRVEEIATE